MTRGADQRDDLSLSHGIARRHLPLLAVCIKRAYTVVMLNDDKVAVAAVIGGTNHLPGFHGINRGTLRRRQINAGVKHIAPRDGVDTVIKAGRHTGGAERFGKVFAEIEFIQPHIGGNVQFTIVTVLTSLGAP